jgi:cobalt-zinc-cadmium resistance protein CzcA
MAEFLEEREPGSVFSFGQPIGERFDELIGGSRSDVSIKIFGPDLDLLQQKAEAVRRVVADIPGGADVRREQILGQPFLRIQYDRSRASRNGVDAVQVLDLIETIAGKKVTEILEGERRFDLQIRLSPSFRRNLEAISRLTIPDSRGQIIPLTSVADVLIEDGPAQISREDNHRVIMVSSNVRGRDIAGFVSEGQRKVSVQVELPPGYWIEWGGQFEQLQDALSRLTMVVPLTLLIIFILLYSAFSSLRLTLLILMNVPIAVTGGILALYLRGIPFSISAGVGFIALFGIAVLNGIVLVRYIRDRRQSGEAVYEAVRRAAQVRFRPVLMTALVASLGFIPMAISTSPGAEVQRPLATVVIGGLITSTLLTLFVLPAIYHWFDNK